MGSVMVEVKDLAMRYGERTALNGIDFEIARGELFGLLGPNGAGKTTLISVLSTLLKPGSGRVTIRSLDVVDRAKEIKAFIGTVPQEIALYSTLSARENLSFYGRIYGLKGLQLKKRIDELLEMVDLSDRKDERVHKYKIRTRVLGDKSILPKKVQGAIAEAEEATKDYDNYYFNLALAYGGREEILSAIKKISRNVKEGRIDIDDINEEMVSGHLYTADLPDPDLILRTSGEVRISNFLLWQLAYSELYFSDVYWPGFRKVDFLRALRSYQMRKRRYGT